MRTPPTPGPWHYETDGRDNVIVYATRDGDDDKIIIGMSHFGPLEVREANARFICAARNDKGILVNQHLRAVSRIAELQSALEAILVELGADRLDVEQIIGEIAREALAETLAEQALA